MAARAAMQAQMDALMGKERDVPVDKRTNRIIQYNDEEVDKFWIAGLSPYVIFRNTRSDLGNWDKIIDDDAKDEFGYEYDLFRLCEQLVSDLDKTIRRTKVSLPH
ncbi:hypothetical protein T484DRAFT_1829281 [Baffinella frigidus]|nr:hypothetical protein T484DRAFT_1829281 [Cryptophyta sp. CCMP2293]